jgi:tRNA dimethylallyltransferase
VDPIYIAGATASGKSAVALLVAEKVRGEIISVDSMQVYRGLDIGTAKPTREERARVPHHLIDVLPANESFDAARFVRLARESQDEIAGRGGVPIYCGGTGLYFNALISGLADVPAPNLDLRVELEATRIEKLLEELKAADPETFERIDRSNARRVLRAVEIIRMTGRKSSEQRRSWRREAGGHWFGLSRERADLNQRIEARVDWMFAAGLVEEIQELLKQGLEQNRTATQAIGYRQVIEHLRGERDLRATVELVKQKTRQFAKRQLTWFRNQLQLEWIKVNEKETAEETALKVIRRLEEN